MGDEANVCENSSGHDELFPSYTYAPFVRGSWLFEKLCRNSRNTVFSPPFLGGEKKHEYCFHFSQNVLARSRREFN